jgi:hypothetical protein
VIHKQNKEPSPIYKDVPLQRRQRKVNIEAVIDVLDDSIDGQKYCTGHQSAPESYSLFLSVYRHRFLPEILSGYYLVQGEDSLTLSKIHEIYNLRDYNLRGSQVTILR